MKSFYDVINIATVLAPDAAIPPPMSANESILLFDATQSDIESTSRALESSGAEERVAWALTRFPERIVLSSSFGVQAAVMLHMVTRQRPDIPVIFVDTGYLFKETHAFVEELRAQLDLNLKVFCPRFTPHWQETHLGRLWEQDLEGIEVYNRINKVEPLSRALRLLQTQVWFSGIRRQQSALRAAMGVLVRRNGRLRVHPIIDWTDRQIHEYLRAHRLPYHPLWHRGYVSIGDRHTTRPLTADISEEETRFLGLKRECGIHEQL